VSIEVPTYPHPHQPTSRATKRMASKATGEWTRSRRTPSVGGGRMRVHRPGDGEGKGGERDD
jgi:hypothetical protein